MTASRCAPPNGIATPGLRLLAPGGNILPAGTGKMIGAALLVSLPFWFVFHRAEQDAASPR